VVLYTRRGGHEDAEEGSYRGADLASVAAEGADKVADVWWKLGISEQTLYTWKRKAHG
jgi:hypothetical protein